MCQSRSNAVVISNHYLCLGGRFKTWVVAANACTSNQAVSRFGLLILLLIHHNGLSVQMSLKINRQCVCICPELQFKLQKPRRILAKMYVKPALVVDKRDEM